MDHQLTVAHALVIVLMIAARASAQADQGRPRYCPPVNVNVLPAESEVIDSRTGLELVPRLPLEDALLFGDADQRLEAAAVLADRIDPRPSTQRDALVSRFIAALSDPNIHVREGVAHVLHRLGTPEAEAALARTVENGRPLPAPAVSASTFSPTTVAAVSAIAPDFLQTLTTLDDAAVRQLIAGLEQARKPDTLPVLVWLFANANPNRRVDIVQLFARWLHARDTPTSGADRERLVALLIESVADPSIDISVAAAEALGHEHAANAAGALVAAVDRLDATHGYLSTIFNAFVSIGSREALPTLERCAATARTTQVRQAAARAYLDIAKPANPGDQVRRLLWEQPDTELERTVLAKGRPALPLAQKALISGTDHERRAAAALLGWFPDTSSIPPILAALARAGAVTRNHLLFDLNMILLTEGTPADVEQRKTLAAQHLQWMYGEIARVGGDDLRSVVLPQDTIAVFPDRIDTPFSLDLSTQSIGLKPGEGFRQFSAKALGSASPDAFRAAVAGTACGVAFHAITVAHGIARVATTLYLPHGRIANRVWISLYHEDRGKWIPFMVPTYPVLQWMLNAPTLLPRINRNYGGGHPLKVLRLDLTMERIRVDAKSASPDWRSENVDIPGRASDLDASYAPLFDRYKRSDVPAVKYTAEYQSVRLGTPPDLQLWIDTLAHPVEKQYLGMAQGILEKVALKQIDTEGRELAGPDRDRLIAAALNPEPVNADLLPSSEHRPRPENIRRVRASSRFGLIDVGFGSGVLGQSGYSMLFERRGPRWVFLCVVNGWIS